MSRIEELVKEKCPDGVEYKPLYEVTTWDKNFKGVEKNKQPKVIKYSVMLAADLFALEQAEGDVFLLSTGEQTGWTTEELAGDNISEGEVVTIPWGKSRKVVDCIKYYKGKFVTGDNRIMTSNNLNQLDNKYLYYCILSKGDVIDTFYRGAGIQHPDMYSMLNLEIPIPPIEVQQEIVCILDKFTELEAELQAELDARKKQYIAVSDSFFDNEVERINITEIADTYIGLVTTMTKHYVPEGVPLIYNSNIKENRFQFSEMTYLDQSFANKNESRKHQLKDIVTVHTGDVGTSAIIEDELVGSLGFATIVTRVKDKSQFLPEYVCYYLNSADNKRNIARMIKSDRSNLNLKDFNRLMIPVYDVDTQKRIVQILSKFHEISVDAVAGLPAEIEARHKQYEYYRDKLLTFERKVV